MYPALFDALDRNDDGQVDESDPVCKLNLLGFSWGGVNVLSIANHLRNDRRVSASHQNVTRAVLLDAFQPLSESRMSIPSNVQSVLSLRHSKASEDDCSLGLPCTYLGLPPECVDGQECIDIDYSESPYHVFDQHMGPRVYGHAIGHCDVPSVGHENVVAFLR